MNTQHNFPPAPSQATAQAPAQGSDDLLTILKALALVWKHRKLVALVTLLFTAGGVGYALMATPVYISEAAEAGFQGG
jgi:uncharacterized protein involved in exopolysaccharide biosynthesis